MIPLFQIPRNSLAWLLAAQVLLILPHLPRLPVWILLAWLTTVVWRVQIFRGIWPFPSRWIKGLIVVLCLTGLLSEYGRFFGIEPMVGLLITAFLLKLLEMRQRRDALMVIFLGYFVAATQFLFAQTLLTTLYLAVAVVILTTALLGMHQSAGHRHPWRSFTLAGKLVLQSLPLMLVLFIAMPRTGSLWSVPQQMHSARSGVSASMSPGDFSNLVQDTTTAFRVTFEGRIPPTRTLYWRGLVLSKFDGRRWTQTAFDNHRGEAVNWNGDPPAPWRQSIATAGEPIAYEVILEPTQQHWLYGLPVSHSSENDIGFTQDYRLVSRQPVSSRYQYRVESHLTYSLAADELPPLVRRLSLYLPENVNPRTRQQAEQWRIEAGDAKVYIERVLSYFNRELTYTLQPPFLGRHSVDEFLWQSKRGFCEHFASAFVVMMRAAGVPARVVVGYQGGELNPLKHFLVVRQADAHAWSEVWLAGQGWVRVDPTAAVAPQRIESGLENALSTAEAELLDDPFSLQGYDRVPLLNLLRLRLEVLEYDWHRWVMGYDRNRQYELLRNLLGAVTPVRLAGLLLLTGILLFLLIGGSLLLSGRQSVKDPGEKLYRRFLWRLKMCGMECRAGEAPRSLARRVTTERPDLNAWVRQVTHSYERYTYAGVTEELARLRRLVKNKTKIRDASEDGR
jgi:protein-glutamine gamma-glutamyltransferase